MLRTMEIIWVAPGQTAPEGAAWFRVVELGPGLDYYRLDANFAVPEELTIGFGAFNDAKQAELAAIEAARRLGHSKVYQLSNDG